MLFEHSVTLVSVAEQGRKVFSLLAPALSSCCGPPSQLTELEGRCLLSSFQLWWAPDQMTAVNKLWWAPDQMTELKEVVTFLSAAELSSQVYWRYPFTALVGPKQLTEFMVMDVERIAEKDKPHHRVPSSHKVS